MERVKRYVWNLLISVDQFANTVLGGDPDETISSRLGKKQDTCRFCRFVCKLLHKLDRRHCVKVIEADRGKPVRTQQETA